MLLLIECCLTAGAIFALYALFSPRIAEALYRPLMFEPHKYPKGLYEANELKQLLADNNVQDIFIPIGGGKNLHAWYFANKHACQTIMICHGNEGNISDMSKLISLLLRCGASVFIFDYQGYGVSDGSPSVKGICKDGFAAYNWLVQTMNLNPETIVLYGESMGANVVCWMIRHCTISGVILQAAATNIRQIGYELFPFLALFPPLLFPRPYFDNLAVLRNKRCPLLLVHGLKDKDVNPKHTKTIFTCVPEPKQMVLLAGTAHDEIDDGDAGYFCRAVSEFLASIKTRVTAGS